MSQTDGAALTPLVHVKDFAIFGVRDLGAHDVCQDVDVVEIHLRFCVSLVHVTCLGSSTRTAHESGQ